MKNNLKRINMIILAGTLCLSVFGGCSSSDKSSPDPSSAEKTEQDAQEEHNESGASVSDKFKPSDLALQRQDVYEYPQLGMNFTLPKDLLEQMDSRKIAMLEDLPGADGTEFDYALITWNFMTKDQLEAETETMGNGFYEWAEQLERIGVLGVYDSGQVENLDKLTKCRKHKKLGESPDGRYFYYISINPDADKKLTKAVEGITIQITDMLPLEDGAPIGEGSLGKFSVQDIKGNVYTEEMFQDYELTMINVFATWCTPCINEIPDLQKLYEELSGKGVNIAGIVLDAVDVSGNIDAEAVEKAELLAERTKASYPFLLPDAGFLNGRLEGIEAVPETFFVDKNGNIVGEKYSGSRSFEEWKKIVETEQNKLKGADS